MKNVKFEMCNFLGKGGSLFFARLYRISAKTHLTLPFNLHEIIIGSMLGDLSAEKPNKNCNTRLQFNQSIINKEYIYHLYQLFEELCNRPPLKEYTSLPCLNIYRELFYNSEERLIYICTESFSLSEIDFLVNILKSKFDLQCSPHKVTNGYRIYI
ncbi:LAGLIDADG homing endonuclease type 2 [Tuber indicum]|nr:LAGLIDADG homing endonuclease type 2 [Tuber indicum]